MAGGAAGIGMTSFMAGSGREPVAAVEGLVRREAVFEMAAEFSIRIRRAGRPAPGNLRAERNQALEVCLRHVFGLDPPFGAAVVVIAQRHAQRAATHPV